MVGAEEAGAGRPIRRWRTLSEKRRIYFHVKWTINECIARLSPPMRSSNIFELQTEAFLLL
jgi:hypothetical protein